MGAMPVGCYKQMSAIKEGVIMRFKFKFKLRLLHQQKTDEI